MLAGLLALFGYLLFGAFTPTLLKDLVTDIPPLTLTFLRFLIASIVFAPLFLIYKDKIKSRKELLELCAVGSLGSILNVSLFALGMKFTTVIIGLVLYGLSPIIVALLGTRLIGEKLTKNQIIGTVVGFLGFAFIMHESFVSSETLTFGNPIGNIIIFFAVISWSFYTLYSRKLSNKYSPVTMSFTSFIPSVVILGILSPFEIYFTSSSLSLITWKHIAELLYLGIMSTITVYFLYLFAIKKTSALVASLSMYLAPFTGAIPAILFFGEKITLNLLIGGAFVLLGVFVATTYQQIRNRKQDFANSKRSGIQ